jgi:divalent metal cation (Fe/Co/Zn/Cd) transporter
MDSALPPEEQARIEAVLDTYRAQGIEFHALRTREAGARVFVSLHVLAPGAWTVQRGHDCAEAIEAAIRHEIPRAHVLTHLEPIEDPISQADLHLDR